MNSLPEKAYLNERYDNLKIQIIMKSLHQAQKLNRAAQKAILGHGTSSCAPTGCHLNAINNSNDRCFILSCPSKYGHMQLVNGTYQCCF